MKTITHSAQDTIDFAHEFLSQLKPGQVLGLVGNLGAGKTQFVKGLAQALEIKKSVLSPTFVLLKPYNIKKKNSLFKKLVHIDCYRLSSPEELLALGFTEFVADKNNLVVVEWADKIKNLMPADTLWLEFNHGQKETDRQIEIK